MKTNILKLFKAPDHHGDASWATGHEMSQAGLMSGKGVLLGQNAKGRPIQANGQFGAIVIAPPRSGKGVSFAIPNGLTWNGSLFATDIKGELYQETAQYRERHGQEIYRFDPMHERTARLNPLDAIPYEIGKRSNAIDLVAHALMPDPDKKEEIIWSTAGRNLFAAVVHYLIDANFPCHLAAVLKEIRKPALSEWAKEILNDMIFMDLEGRDAWQAFIALEESPKFMAGVISTVDTALALWSNPNVAAATETSDFDLSDLRKKRMSVYLCINPADLARLSPLINIMLQQMLQSLLREKPGADESHQVLMLIDEMPAFGKLPVFVKAVGYLASYNMIFVPIIQDWHQLVGTYGENDAQTILNTSQYQIYFNVQALKTAEMLSKRLGTTTELVKTKSRRSFWGNNAQVNESFVSKPLMNASQIMQMPNTDEIIIARGLSPIYAHKFVYYNDPRFQKRISHEL